MSDATPSDERDHMLCMMCEHDLGLYQPGRMEPCSRCGESHGMNAKYRIEMMMVTPGKIGRHKNLVESRRVRRSVNAETGHLVGEHRVIDRRASRYYKRMVDTVTGEEVHRVEEPLSVHRGRGSAKPPAN